MSSPPHPPPRPVDAAASSYYCGMPQVAFVALAQSRGKASEAAAVLQRSRIKDEATMVATMLDVTSFIDLACKVAERRRFYRLAEEEKTQRQQRQNRRSRCCRLPLSPQYHHQQSELRELRGDLQAYHQFHQHQHHHGCSGDHCDNVRRSDSTTSADSNLTQEEREDQRFKVEPFDSGADFIGAVEIRGDSRSNRAGDDEYGGEKQSTSRENHSRTTARGSRGPTGSPVPPAVLPPLVGLADGSDTPPTPNTLKTILATSTSVAVAIPSGLGLAPKHAVGGDAGRLRASMGNEAGDVPNGGQASDVGTRYAGSPEYLLSPIALGISSTRNYLSRDLV